MYIYVYMPLHIYIYEVVRFIKTKMEGRTGFAQAWGKAQSCQIFFQSDHGTMPEKTIIPSVGQ